MNFTFDSIVTKMKDYLSLLSDWTKTLYFGVYSRIIDVVAYITEKRVQLAEFFYNEANWLTATRLESLLQKSFFLDYTPHRKISAEGNIVLSADPDFSSGYIYSGETVVIPKYFQFTDSTGDILTYSTEEKTYYQNTSGNLTIPVKEGTVTEFLYNAQGVNDEVVYIYSDSVENTELQIDIVDDNEDVLNSVGICGQNDIKDELYFINDINNYYCKVETAYNMQSVKIIFGDDVRTKKLNTGDKVRVKYIISKGSLGNINGIGVINTLNSALVDGDGNEVTLYIRNNEAITNGNDNETKESIRYNAPNLFEAGYRCAGEDDWKTVLENHPYIYRVKIWSNEDLGNLADPTESHLIFVTAISSAGEELTVTQKAEIVSDLKENSKSFTEVISWETVKIIKLKFEIVAKVTNIDYQAIKSTILSDLDDSYGVLNVDFSTDVYDSNYTALIDNVSTVDRHETLVWYLEENFSYTTTDHEIEVSLKTGDISGLTDAQKIYVSPSTVEIWIKRKIENEWQAPIQIGYDDGSGTITGMNGYTIIDGSVSYTENTISWDIETIRLDPFTYGVPDPAEDNENGYIISLCYRTQDGTGDQETDIRFPKNQGNFITDIDNNYVFFDLDLRS